MRSMKYSSLTIREDRQVDTTCQRLLWGHLISACLYGFSELANITDQELCSTEAEKSKLKERNPTLPFDGYSGVEKWICISSLT